MDPQFTQPSQPPATTPVNNAEQTPASAPTPKPAPVKGDKNNKLLIIVGVLVLIILAGAVVYAATHKKKAATTNVSTKQQYGADEEPEEGLLQTEAELSDYKQEAEITITANGYSPQALTMPNDSKIIWHNIDKKPHTVTITPGTPVPDKLQSKFTIEAGNGHPYVIHQKGTFHYFDVDNPKLSGQFTIQ